MLDRTIFLYLPQWAASLSCLPRDDCSQKEFNIKRHYESKHSKYSEYTGLIRIDKIKALKKSISKQQMVFTKINENSEKGTRVSLAISHLIAKNMKPFSDGEFVKECIMTVVDLLCPDEKNVFANVSLSSSTVTRRIEDIAENVKFSLKMLLESFNTTLLLWMKAMIYVTRHN